MVIREVAYANYFGRHFLGTIKGVIMPINLISFAGGPLLAAWLKDITGSYRLAFQFFFILAVLGTIVLYFAKPPQKKA